MFLCHVGIPKLGAECLRRMDDEKQNVEDKTSDQKASNNVDKKSCPSKSAFVIVEKWKKVGKDRCRIDALSSAGVRLILSGRIGRVLAVLHVVKLGGLDLGELVHGRCAIA